MMDQFGTEVRRLARLVREVDSETIWRPRYKGYLGRARTRHAKAYRRAEDLWPFARHVDLRGSPDLAATRAGPLSDAARTLVERWARLATPTEFALWTRRLQDGPRRKSRRLADRLPTGVVTREALPSDLPVAAPSRRQELVAAHRRSEDARIAAERDRRCAESRIRALRGLSPLHEPSGRARGLWGSLRSPTPAADLARGTAILVGAARHLRRLWAEGASDPVLHGAEEAYRQAMRPLHRARLAHVERLGPQERSRELGRLAALAAAREEDGLLDPVHAPIRLETLRALVPDPQEAEAEFAGRMVTFDGVRVRQLVEAGEGLSDEATPVARAEACRIVLDLLGADRPALPRYTRADVEAALRAAAFDVERAVPPHAGDLDVHAQDLEGLREHVASCRAPELVDLRARLDRAWSEVAGARDAFLADPPAWRETVAEVQEARWSEREAERSLVPRRAPDQRGRDREAAEARRRQQEIDHAAAAERHCRLQQQAEERAEAERHRLRQVEEEAERRRAPREAERSEREPERPVEPRSSGSPGSAFEP